MRNPRILVRDMRKDSLRNNLQSTNPENPLYKPVLVAIQPPIIVFILFLNTQYTVVLDCSLYPESC